jgi:tetraacyldisaccharide 4'-kinase
MADWLQRQWYRLGIWHLVLIPLSWLFCVISALRRLAYRAHVLPSFKLPVPVIVVGNISVGGTGKTPLVVWLAKRLQAAGFKPGIISRGYGADIAEPVRVTRDSAAQDVGDEPLLIAGRTSMPVWVGQDRVATARKLLEANPECDLIISDDGLQHYRMQRDIEIAVIDGRRQFGNGWLLPAGPLRESVARLQQVDAVVCHGAPVSELPQAFVMQLTADAFHQVSDPNTTRSADDFISKRLLAIAGIGHPERFFEQLRRMQLTFASRAFPDHHPYRAEDLQTQGIDAILMTEKDAVKCRAFAQKDWWYLPVEADVQDGLLDRLLPKLRN